MEKDVLRDPAAFQGQFSSSCEGKSNKSIKGRLERDSVSLTLIMERASQQCRPSCGTLVSQRKKCSLSFGLDDQNKSRLGVKLKKRSSSCSLLFLFGGGASQRRVGNLSVLHQLAAMRITQMKDGEGRGVPTVFVLKRTGGNINCSWQVVLTSWRAFGGSECLRRG